jgi:ATP-binding cassette subfamily C protein LapB
MLAQPALWLLDEPTANLDIDTEARVLAALGRKIRPDAAMVLVTHKIQLLNLVQRVILVANGSIVLDGPTAEVLQRLQTPAKAQPAQNAGTAEVNQPVGEKK